MYHARLIFSLTLSTCLTSWAATPQLPNVGKVMQEMITSNEIAGAVTVVVSKDKVLHLECTGFQPCRFDPGPGDQTFERISGEFGAHFECHLPWATNRIPFSRPAGGMWCAAWPLLRCRAV